MSNFFWKFDMPTKNPENPVNPVKNLLDRINRINWIWVPREAIGHVEFHLEIRHANKKS
jgi:hypothetical protein